MINKCVKTTCPYCGVGCGVLASNLDDGSSLIKGDPDHPSNFGRLCSKGTNLGETLSLDERLLVPSIEGQDVSWDKVLSHVSDKFSAVIEEHGPEAVALYVSGQFLTEDYYVANKFMKGCVGSANIDTNSRLCMSSSVVGHKRAFGSDTVPNIYEDLEASDVVVLVGSNLVWCHPILFQRLEAVKAKRPDFKIICIDPRATVTARASDLHLALKSGTDVALFNGLLASLHERGLFDDDYIGAHVAGMGDALTTAQALSIDEIAGITGLPSVEMEEFYELFANNPKVMTLYSQGVNQSSSGTDKVNSILNCHLATGRIGKEGSGPLSLTGQPNAMGGREVGGMATMLACHMDLEDEQHRDIVGRFWQSDVVPSSPGFQAVDLFQAIDRGDVKAVWIMATNPVDSMPDADFVKAALEKCELVVVSDVSSNTDTVAMADVLLPALAWGEKSGTVTNSERRISRQVAFLDAPGEAKADWWQIQEVARRMGYGAQFSFTSARDVFVEYAALSAYENDGTRDFDIGALADLSEKEYDELAPQQWPCSKTPVGSIDDKKRFFASGNFYTPSGKANAVATAFLDPASKLSDDFPLVLNTGRIRDQWHTMTRTAKSARLMRHISEPFVEINPVDARRLNILKGRIVRVSSSKGEVLLKANVTEDVAPGMIFAPIHWTDQFASMARIDTLVAAHTDPFSGQPESKFTPVQLAAFTPKSYGYVLTRNKPDLEVLGELCSEELFYWSLSPVDEGWVLECAGDLLDRAGGRLVSAMMGFDISQREASLEVLDPAIKRMRRAYFDGERLDAFLAVSPDRVALSREFMMGQLPLRFKQGREQQFLLYGWAAPDVPDIGPIICSCFTVGAVEIRDVIKTSNVCSVQMVGECTKAGTNCGSCRLEIQKILDEMVSLPDSA